jgi:hypothetical protein
MPGDLTGSWQLVNKTHDGSSSQGQLLCTKWSNFITPSSSTRQVFIGNQILAGYNEPPVSTSMPDGTFASAIRTVNGHFNGGGEYVQITQGSFPSRLSQLTVSGEADGMWGAGVAIQNGKDDANVIAIGYINSVKSRGTVNTSGTFEFPVATDGGYSGYWMANTSGSVGGVCYLTRVTGNFDGTPESVAITDQGGTWSIDVTRGGSGRYVRAKARCMAYDQRPL